MNGLLAIVLKNFRGVIMTNINDLQEQFENLIKQGQELLEKMKEERFVDTSETKRWKPKDGETYWYIFGDGTIDFGFWTSKDNTLLGRYKLGNCFKTGEEAQKELNRRIAEQKLLDLVDWDGGEKVYLIEYNDQRDVFDLNWFDYIYSPYRFSSEESCQKAIDTLGTEKLKLIFRID